MRKTAKSVKVYKFSSKNLSQAFFEGNYTEYEAWKKANLGEEAQPHRLKFKKVTK